MQRHCMLAVRAEFPYCGVHMAEVLVTSTADELIFVHGDMPYY